MQLRPDPVTKHNLFSAAGQEDPVQPQRSEPTTAEDRFDPADGAKLHPTPCDLVHQMEQAGFSESTAATQEGKSCEGLAQDNDGERQTPCSAHEARRRVGAWAWPERRARLPVAVCGMALGLSGMLKFWVYVTTMLLDADWSSLSVAGRACTAAYGLAVLALIAAYLGLGLRSGGLLADMRHSTRRSLVSASSMALMLLSWIFHAVVHWEVFGSMLLWTGVISHCVLQPLTLFHLLRQRPRLAESRIVWVVPLVGIGLLADVQGGQVPEQIEGVAAAFGIGYFLLLLPLIFGSVPFYYNGLQDNAAEAELPHVAVLLAPCGVALNAWLYVAYKHVPQELADAGAVFLLMPMVSAALATIIFLPRLALLPASPVAASYTFPFLITGKATLHWACEGSDGELRDLESFEKFACWVIVAACAAPPILAIGYYVLSVRRGKLLVLEPQPRAQPREDAGKLEQLEQGGEAKAPPTLHGFLEPPAKVADSQVVPDAAAADGDCSTCGNSDSCPVSGRPEPSRPAGVPDAEAAAYEGVSCVSDMSRVRTDCTLNDKEAPASPPAAAATGKDLPPPQQHAARKADALMAG